MTILKVTLYDNDNEPVKTFTRTFVPWKLLKRAVRLMKTLNVEELSEADVDELAALVVDVFGNQFTADELNDGADVGEMMTVLEAIMVSAQGSLPNPAPLGKN